jgi:hypothetical protein
MDQAFYYYDVFKWLFMDQMRIHRSVLIDASWQHLNNRHVVLCLTNGIPWYAAWDLAFHGILVEIRPYLQQQLLWY